MGRKTNQRHPYRKSYKNVDAYFKAQEQRDASLYGKAFYPSQHDEVLRPEVVQTPVEKYEAVSPFLVAEQQPMIFAGDKVNPIHTCEDICHLAEFVKQRYSENARMLQLYNSRLMDIQHEIEMLPAKDASKGYCVYKDQREVLLARRVAKDENALLEPIKTLIEKNAGFFSDMAEVLNQIEHIYKNRADRRYSYRAPELMGGKDNE